MIIYLYKKTHNLTGLKYLGKTKNKNPYTYTGSGKLWLRHIKKHGYNVSTEILRECKSTEELKYWGQFYSQLWDIVGSDEWANLKIEMGDGGAVAVPWNKGKKLPPLSPEIKAKKSMKMRGRPAHNKGVPNPNVSESNRKRLTGVPRSEKDKLAISMGGKGKKMTTTQCPHCNKVGGRGNMHRYHFNNCKYSLGMINN